jgi:nucleotide-binding universal stress UspA family protein
MNGTIICTIDDSDGVHAALHVARRLSARFDARMVLVSVAPGFRGENGRGDSLTSERARQGAQQRLERLAAEHRLADEEHRIAAGDPAEAVAIIAAEEAADLIVVGARQGLLGWLRSSLARELAATASCPVVVVPPESADTALATSPT